VSTIDFGEVDPERFEYFAREFLEALGFETLEGPDRGSEEGRDLLVREPGAITREPTVWLVSCKHKGASGKAVGVADEPDIAGRLTGRADGFMGFYSTPPSSALTRVLARPGSRIRYYIFDPARIENLLTSRESLRPVLSQYFPRSCRSIALQSARLKVHTEAGFSLYAKDIAFEVDSVLHHDGTSLRVDDPELEATITACHVAKRLRAGRFDVLRGIASFNPLVWKAVLMLLRFEPLPRRTLASAIRNATDSLELRLLISLAGELGVSDTCQDICLRILNGGRQHHGAVEELRLVCTPFLDVARDALARLGPRSRPVLKRYEGEARRLRRWTEHRVFEAALKRHDHVYGAA